MRIKSRAGASVEIPSPIEVETTLCKKHIKKIIFEIDCELKVQEHRILAAQSEQQRNNSIITKEKKGQDRIAKNRKQRDQLLIDKKLTENAKRQDILTKRDQMQKQWEDELVEKQQAIEEREKAWRQQIIDRQKKFEHDSYLQDQRNVKQEQEKSMNHMSIQFLEEQDLQKKLQQQNLKQAKIDERKRRLKSEVVA